MYTYITLKQLRELRNYTQKEVAAKIGLTQSAYSKIENFDCQTSMENYNKLSNLFDVEVDQIITNRIQALIHIKTASTSRDQFIEKNAPMVADIIKSIKEHEFRLNMLLQGIRPA
jgi:transcriptional regulator with XRE-family HTH domain